jgi:hypothetical protein
LSLLVSKNVQARFRNLVDFYKRVEDMEEAGEHIAFALDERLAFWNVYSGGLIASDSPGSSWVRGSLT